MLTRNNISSRKCHPDRAERRGISKKSIVEISQSLCFFDMTSTKQFLGQLLFYCYKFSVCFQRSLAALIVCENKY